MNEKTFKKLAHKGQFAECTFQGGGFRKYEEGDGTNEESNFMRCYILGMSRIANHKSSVTGTSGIDDGL
jgi:hypothetical protein